MVAALAQPGAAAPGGISTIAGTGVIGYNGGGIRATTATLANPQGVAVDALGNRLIVDTASNRVRVVAVSASNPGYPIFGCASTCTWTAGDIYTIAGPGAPGYNGDDVPAATGELDAPSGVVVDHHGNPLVADTLNNRVRVIAVSASNPGYPTPRWTVGDIYTVAGNGTGSYNGDGIPGPDGELSSPQAVTVDTTGNLLITDTADSRVRVMALSASNPGYPLTGCTSNVGPVPCVWMLGDIYTMAGPGPGFNGDGIPAVNAEVNEPRGVTVDGEGNPIIADAANDRVRVIAVSASNPGYPVPGWTVGDIYTIAGAGTGSYTPDGVSAPTAEINTPGGVAVDHAGNPLLVDSGNQRVRVVAVSGANPGYLLAGCAGACHWSVGDIYTVTGDGSGAYNGDGIPATSAQLNFPAGLAIDTIGNFYIADTSNSRVREVQVGATVNPPCPPRSVSAVPLEQLAVVHWVIPSCNGGSAITGYVVTPHLGATALTPHLFNAAATTGTISGLTVKRTYRFTVAAQNVAGAGRASGSSNAVTIGAPAPPARPTVAKVSAGALAVKFRAPANNGAPIAGFTATCASANGGRTRSKAGRASPITVTGLSVGKTYACTVAATNSRGTGPASPPSAAAKA